MERPTIEELLNKISLLKKALEFYSNEKNYNQNVNVNANLTSKIEIDEGHQARFALDQIKNIEEYNQSLIEEYKMELKETKEITERETFDSIVKLNKLIFGLGNKKE